MRRYLKKMVTALAFITVSISYSSAVFAADIVEAATEAGSFKTFIAALEAAGFTESLKTSGPYTVFAPSDEAFAKLPQSTWNALLQDKSRLAQVLAYHMIPGRILVAEVKPGNIKTIQGSTLHLSSDNGKITVDNANVTQSDVIADNGVIHAIDTVVLPEQNDKQ